MKVNYKQLEKMQQSFAQVNEQMVEEWINECLRDLAKKQIRKLKKRTPVNTGLLRNSWSIGTISKSGHTYEIEVYTDIEYASFVEKGFRAHWVPGYWEGKQFVYDKEAKTGMQVGKPGSWVQGKFMMRISELELEREMPKFLQRKQKEFLQRVFKGGS